MSWLQIIADVPRAGVEILEQRLEEAGAVAVTLQDCQDCPLLEPGAGQTPLWPEVTVTGLFPAGTCGEQLLAYVLAQTGSPRADRIQLTKLQDQDWQRAWLDRFQPMRFGKQLWIIPGDAEPPDPSAINLQLDPGLAFGTGTHPTTAMCLEWIDGHDISGRQVLDFGCGSGILGIATALKGASRVRAVDHDPQAIIACRENARRNEVVELMEIIAADSFKPCAVDLVLANILAKPLIELAETLQNCLKPGGRLVLSGMLAGQQQSVQDAYQGVIDWQPARQSQDWICLSGTRIHD